MMEDIKTEISEVKGKIAGLEEKIERYELELNDASTPADRKREIEVIITALRADITALRADITALRNKENLLIQQNSTTGKYGNLYIYSVCHMVFVCSIYLLSFHLLISSFYSPSNFFLLVL